MLKGLDDFMVDRIHQPVVDRLEQHPLRLARLAHCGAAGALLLEAYLLLPDYLRAAMVALAAAFMFVNSFAIGGGAYMRTPLRGARLIYAAFLAVIAAGTIGSWATTMPIDPLVVVTAFFLWASAYLAVCRQPPAPSDTEQPSALIGKNAPLYGGLHDL